MTVEIPAALYHQSKVRAALKGQTVRAFLLDAVQEKLAGGLPKPADPAGWRRVLGKASPEDVYDVQRRIDEECSRI